MRVFSVIVLLLSTCLLCFCSNKKKAKNINWKETIGTIEPRGTLTWIHYYVENNKFSERYYLKKFGEVLGEKYTMRYNVDNPHEIQIDYWNPIFEENEETCLAVAEVKKVAWFNFSEPKYSIRYSFEVNGYRIQKVQTLPPNYKSYYPNLQKGQFYEVEYLCKNLGRAKIKLQSPVGDKTK